MQPTHIEAYVPDLRSTGMWFVGAGVLVVVRAVIELAEPMYWNPSSPLDYSAAILTTVAWVVTGVAFILWWRTTPIRRGSLFLLVAGFGTAVSGIGNFVEDVLDLKFGELLFTYGGMVGAMAVLVAAVLILTVRHPLRWTGLLLVAFVAGGIFPDSGGQFLTGASLVGLGIWLVLYQPKQHRDSHPTHP
jgi:hypothetical protein